MSAAARRDYAAAIELLARAVKTTPDASLYFNRAVMLQQLGRHAEAITDYTHALRMRSDDVDAHFNRASAYAALGLHAEAVADYDAVLAMRPKDAATLNNRGVSLSAMARHEEALSSFEEAIRASPDDARAYHNAGTSLRALNRHQDAVGAFDRALALASGHAGAWTNRGLSLEALDRASEAVASHDKALALSRTPERLINRGNALLAQNKLDDALASFEAALALDPNDANARFAQAQALLSLGRFEDGWAAFEARWASKSAPEFPALTSPRWLGEQQIGGKSILVHAEQGLGDTIQFVRFVRGLTEAGADVHLRVQSPLKDLIAESLTAKAHVAGYDDPSPETDFHIPLMSLPHALRTRLADYEQPYLSPNEMRQAPWLRAPAAPRIGVVWRGEQRNHFQARRTMELEILRPIFNAKADFICLQYGVTDAEKRILAEHNIAHHGNRLDDFREYAAAIASCDLIITIDTVTAHLAGAVGKPAWIMLPFWSDWRWRTDTDDTAWYPQARLFRQSMAGDWPSVVRAIVRALEREPWPHA